MELQHPVMFLVVIADLIGGSVAEFAGKYPYILYSWLVMGILIVLARIATAKITMVPSGLQNVFEFAIEAMGNLQDSVMGGKGKVFFPLVMTMIMYVWFCNLMGLIPGGYAPTANLNTTAGLAIIIFVLTHFMGFKVNGIGYLKHFMGPMLILAPLFFVIEVVSHFSRLISLSLRLFGNVMGEELVILILFVLAGAYFMPLPMMFLGLFAGFLQAFIIALLAMVYINEAMAHD